MMMMIGIGNTIMNIGSSVLPIQIVITFVEQNGKIHTILVLLELQKSLRQSSKTARFADVCFIDVSFLTSLTVT